MYKPLPDEVYLKESEIHGMGLFAKHIINSGVNLGMTHVYDSEQENSRIRTPLGGFINHSEEPNCEIIKIGKYYYLMTDKDIMPDEEITLKYTLYEVSSL
jgi:SET domain-containing protein